MQIVEVREGYIKIESSDTLPVSSFVEIDDDGKKYVAQILQSKKIANVWICYAKFQFLYQGELVSYDKTVPSKNSVLNLFPFEIISKAFDNVNPIVIGNFSNGQPILTDKTIFDKNIIVSIDNPDNNKIFVANTMKQFNKTIVIDMLGVCSNEKKYVAGVDFKLPLNTSSLEFMYQDCLNDATSDSKSLIKEIFQDLSQYSETVKFVPFSILKSIIDDMVDKEHIFKLLVLKNKLAKFEKLGYFASTIEEVNCLEKILVNNESIIDLSKLDSIFQNRYLTTVLDLIKSQGASVQVILEASNSINKQNLKRVFTDDDLSITFVTHSRFKYINELKTVVENFLVEPNSANKEVFKPCKLMLDALSDNQYLLLGKSFGGLALASTFEEITILEKSVIESVPEFNVQENTDKELFDEETTLSEEDVESLENSLNEDASVAENINENDEISVINRKSEELIEKVAEEIIFEDSSQVIFTEDDVEDLDLDKNEVQEVQIVEEAVVDVEQQEDFVEEITELELLEEESEEEFASEVIDIIEEPVVETPESMEILQEDEITETIEEPLTEESLEGDASAIVEVEENEFKTEVDEIHTIEIPKDISDLTSDDLGLIEVEETFEEKESGEVLQVEENDINPDAIGFKDFTDESENIAPIPMAIQESTPDDEFDEIMELDVSEISEDDILIDITDDVEMLDEDSLDKQIVEDVDKVFTTMKDDSISDSDLDFIDELNSSVETEELVMGEGLEELSDFTDFEDVEEEGFIEPLEEISDLNSLEDEEKEILETKQGNTPIVPVYGAEIPPEDVVISDPIEQGDTVTHAKYGIGVVEKMIKYGTKTLYSINFDNVGRRLLDPTLTEIKKS